GSRWTDAGRRVPAPPAPDPGGRGIAARPGPAMLSRASVGPRVRQLLRSVWIAVVVAAMLGLVIYTAVAAVNIEANAASQQAEGIGLYARVSSHDQNPILSGRRPGWCSGPPRVVTVSCGWSRRSARG